MTLKFKQPITETTKLQWLDVCCKNSEKKCWETYNECYKNFQDGFYEHSYNSEYPLNDLALLRSLDIWQEEEIEIGTPCKFWDDDEDNFLIAYYGGCDECRIYRYKANNASGEHFSDYENCEPISEIPKYKGNT